MLLSNQKKVLQKCGIFFVTFDSINLQVYQGVNTIIMKTVYLLILTIFLFGCKASTEAEESLVNANQDTAISAAPTIVKRSITYHLAAINKETIPRLNSIISTDSLQVLLYLNRVDKKHLLRQDTLIVPDTFYKDIRKYAPFPDSLEQLKKVHKIIFYAYSIQAFGAYENGSLVRWGPVSMGKKSTPTPTGLMHTNWKSLRAISTIDPEWIMNWYFNLDNLNGVSMHEYDLPGYPASHACVRLYQEDALWFYNWAEQWKLISNIEIGAYGTPVLIFGNYPFGKRKPWLELATDSNALTITSGMLETELQKYMVVILERQTQRDSFLKSK
jgi:hypothetical protein